MVDTVALEKVMINNCIEHFNSLNGERVFFESREECGHIPSVLHIEYYETIKRMKETSSWLYYNLPLIFSKDKRFFWFVCFSIRLSVVHIINDRRFFIANVVRNELNKRINLIVKKYVVKSEKIISVQDRKVFDNARIGEWYEGIGY